MEVDKTAIMPNYSVTITKIAGEVGHAQAPEKTEGITLDISRDSNPDLLNPAELLLAAFGGCLLKNIGKLAPKMRLVIDDARVQVTGVRQDDPPHMESISYQLVLTTQEPKQKIERLVNYLHEYGTVYNTLLPLLSVSEKIMLERGNGWVEQLSATTTK